MTHANNEKMGRRFSDMIVSGTNRGVAQAVNVGRHSVAIRVPNTYMCRVSGGGGALLIAFGYF